MKIIGISGKAGCGKDTIGDYLVAHRNFIKLSFATPMKHMISVLLNKPVSWIEDRANKEEVIPSIGYSPRELLQTLGTEWGRETLNKDFWVDIVWRQIDELLQTGKHAGIVLTDCRFENEASRLRKTGGIVCHVTRAAAPNVQTHASEQGIKFMGNDYLIQNATTIPDLHTKVDQMLTKYDTLVRLGGKHD